MTRSTRLLLLLLWKNAKIQQRRIILTVFEIMIPVVFALILISVRHLVSAQEMPNGKNYSRFDPLTLPNSLCPTKPLCVYPFLLPWTVSYAPSSNFTDAVMKRVLKRSSQRIINARGFANESAMVDDLVHCLNLRPNLTMVDDLVHCLNLRPNLTITRTPDLENTCIILGGVVFEKYPHNLKQNMSVKDIRYKIRLRYSWSGDDLSDINDLVNEARNAWNTGKMYPVFQLPGPRSINDSTGGPPYYERNGFLALQSMIDLSVIEEYSEWALHLVPNKSDQNLRQRLEDLPYYPIHMLRMPYPAWRDDNFVMVVQQYLPFFLMLGFVLPALTVAKDVVHEKERRIKETLKVLGVESWLHWAAWFTQYALFLFITVVLMTTFLVLPLSKNGAVVGLTAPGVLLLFLFVYAMATVCFSFLISAFFSRANAAAAAAGILFFLTYIPYMFLQLRYDQLSMGAKISSCLLSNLAMAWGGQVIGMFEGSGSGVRWSNLGQGVSIDDPFSMAIIIGMLLLDSLLYFTLAWYIEEVFPGEHGVPRPWYFLCSRSYWCGQRRIKEDSEDCSDTTPLLPPVHDRHNPSYFEQEPQGLATGVRLENLRKVFKRGGKPAVRGMNMNMYEGQITVLLGHNGAGKTTTIAMITGFLPSSSGGAHVAGYDVSTELERVRENLGLCPQHDVLFDSLTVDEHLRFYARLKGVDSKRVPSETSRTLASVGLEDKRHALSMTLSGGQKRKLSVALALVGGSQVVILDEPTSGLDPNARRQIWDILNAHKQGRTILLTTHYMYEADILGDRIGIMAHGSLKCLGTPLFLKHKYGAGYNLVIVKNAACDVDELTKLIQRYVATAELQSAVSAELTYSLPYDTKQSFEALFIELEQNTGALGIRSYGVSVTTMEEVFIRVGELNDTVSECTDDVGTNSTTSIPGTQASSRATSESDLNISQTSINARGYVRLDEGRIERHNRFVVHLVQLYGLLVKRALHTYRNLVLTLSQLLIPVLFSILALVVMRTIPEPDSAPPLRLDMTRYGANTVLFNDSRKADATHTTAHFYAKQFSHKLHVVNSSKQTVEDYILSVGSNSLPSYNNDLNIAASFDEYGSDFMKRAKLLAFFNNQAFHNPPISLAAIMNALFAYVTNDSDVSITTVNHPLPRTGSQEVTHELLKSFNSFTLTFCLLFGFSFLTGSFAVFLIHERSTKAKHVQLVSGVHPLTFWLATFLWDLLNFMVPCLVIMIVFAAFQLEQYVGDGRIAYIFLLFLMYSCAGLWFVYLASMLFSVPSSGLVWFTVFSLISGIFTVMAVNILSLPQLNLESTANALEWVFITFVPSFCLGQALNNFYENQIFLKICADPLVVTGCAFNITNPCCADCTGFCLFHTTHYLSWERGAIGRYVAFLGVQAVVFFLILMAIELQLPKKMWYMFFAPRRVEVVSTHEDLQMAEDYDVATERQRVVATDPTLLRAQNAVVLTELTKCYPGLNTVAVDSLSVGIGGGECFGLLGVNGAGKTSTFQMLTGDQMVTAGNAHLLAHSVKTDISQVRSVLGYCPQYDALIGQLTGHETLCMFARLRGVKNISEVVDSLLSDLLLKEHAHKLVKNYSGGNKRKLSAAVALVGGPPILLLDEPSCGMDPVARRQLWRVLDQARMRGRTMLLTSHSMEECEALCTRLAIMVNGRFKCLGSTQHLKSKFGQGFTLLVQVAPLRAQPFIDYIATTFPQCSVLKDAHQGMLHFHLTDPSLPWSQLFAIMERAKEKFELDDYSLSQTTLEQVFITFAQAQSPPVEREATCCRRLTCGLC